MEPHHHYNLIAIMVILESRMSPDRLAGLWDAMNDTVLRNQRDVVKNERRQTIENRPYGVALCGPWDLAGTAGASQPCGFGAVVLSGRSTFGFPT